MIGFQNVASKAIMRLFFHTPSLIGSINEKIFILTNQLVFLMRLTTIVEANYFFRGVP